MPCVAQRRAVAADRARSSTLPIPPRPQAISIHLRASDMAVDHRKDQHHFKFDAVLHNATQDAVYDARSEEHTSELQSRV